MSAGTELRSSPPWLDLETPLLQRHMPSLDVLRGLAILWVLLNHGLLWGGATPASRGLARLPLRLAETGWLGVNLFFVLSGFLITGLLLDRRANVHFFRSFYVRRARRILPPYLLLLSVLCLLHQMSLGALAVALTFTTNDAFLFGVRQPYGLLWSIAVEEQFYLLWPFFVRHGTPLRLTSICAALLLLDPLLRYGSAAGYLPPADVQRNALLIADNLACGALAALFVRSRFGVARWGLRVGGVTIGVAALIEAVGLPFGILHRDTPFGAALQHTPWNLFFTGLMLALLALPSRWFSGFWTAPLRFFGFVSYGLYLYHLLVFEAYDLAVAHLAQGAVHSSLTNAYVRLVVAVALATLVAWLSRRFFEEPFLRRGRTSRTLVAPQPAPDPRSAGADTAPPG